MTPLPELEPAGLAKLAKEYRPSMDAEVLHSWAADVVAALTATPNQCIKCTSCGASSAHLSAARSVPEAGKAVNTGDLEEALRMAEVGEFLYNACAYSYGDGYTEPREYGIEWQWQQRKPDEYGQGQLLAASTKWHADQADDGTVTEAAKLRAALASVPAPSGAEPARAVQHRLRPHKQAEWGPWTDGPQPKDYLGWFELRDVPQALPAEDFAGLVERLRGDDTSLGMIRALRIEAAAALASLHRKYETALQCYEGATVRREASEAEASDLRRKLASVERERDRQYDENVSRIASEGAAILRAETAERKVEEASKAMTDLINIIDLGWEAHNEDDSDKPIMANARAVLRILGASE